MTRPTPTPQQLTTAPTALLGCPGTLAVRGAHGLPAHRTPQPPLEAHASPEVSPSLVACWPAMPMPARRLLVPTLGCARPPLGALVRQGGWPLTDEVEIQKKNNEVSRTLWLLSNKK